VFTDPQEAFETALAHYGDLRSVAAEENHRIQDTIPVKYPHLYDTARHHKRVLEGFFDYMNRFETSLYSDEGFLARWSSEKESNPGGTINISKIIKYIEYMREWIANSPAELAKAAGGMTERELRALRNKEKTKLSAASDYFYDMNDGKALGEVASLQHNDFKPREELQTAINYLYPSEN
jgi:hypothetical protein